jgi:retron-type reverse transcriptase
MIVIYHNPIVNAIIKGSKNDWNGLPRDKSLFYTPKNKGLPIGNLTSQLFGNIYLDILDKYIKYELEFKHYGRYVDDFFIVSRCKKKLTEAVESIGKIKINKGKYR